MLSYSIDWVVTDADATPLGTVAASGGSLTFDGKANVKRVARGVRFDPDGWRDVNPFTDWFMPMFRTAHGERTPLGMFAVAGLPYRYVAGDVTLPPEPYLADGGLLLDTASETTIAGRVGDDVSEVVDALLDAANVTRRIVERSGVILAEPVAYPVGTTYSSALSGLCDLAGFLPPYFDRDGVLRVRNYPEGDLAPDAVYDGTSIIAESRVEDSDLFTAPNVWIVVGSGATNGSVVSVREVGGGSPNSVGARGGRRIAQVVREQGVSSRAQADRIAASLAELSSQSFRTIEFATAPNPMHDGFAVVEVNNVTMFETSWTMGLDTGNEMTHTVVSRLELT